MGTLKDLGEEGIIHLLDGLTHDRMHGRSLGIGDDAAVVGNYDEPYNYLVTTDMLVENVHFKVGWSTPYQLGYRSLAVNLSDIAAMGGFPLSSFLSLSLPCQLDESWMREFSRGYADLSNLFHTSLLGGDTVGSVHDIVINVTVVGKVLKGHEKLRSAAQIGDLIVVSGTLGDATAGRLILDKHDRSLEPDYTPEQAFLVQRFLEPLPRLALGQALSKLSGVHAMMDLSDGLVSDLPHILRRSHVSASVALDRLPLSADFVAECEKRSKYEAERVAVTGGEDYELLFTVSPDAVDRLPEPDPDKGIPPLTVIGEVTRDDSAQITWTKEGRKVRRSFKPYSHF